MAQATPGHWRKLNISGHYLTGTPRAVVHFAFQQAQYRWMGTPIPIGLVAGAQSALPVDERLCMVGTYSKPWTSTQHNITLSSAEADLVAVKRAC